MTQSVGFIATAEGVVEDPPPVVRIVGTISEDYSNFRCDNCPKKFEDFPETVEHALKFGHTTRHEVQHHIIYRPFEVADLPKDQVTEIVAIATVDQ